MQLITLQVIGLLDGEQLWQIIIMRIGRLLKCGACNHTWFYKPSEHTEKNEILLNDNVSVEIEKKEVITNIIKKSESTESNPDQFNEDKKITGIDKTKIKENIAINIDLCLLVSN